MQKQYDDTNKGAMWRATKQDNERFLQRVPKGTPPILTGTINIDGREYWISGFKPNSTNPKAPALSLTVKEKKPRQEQAQTPRTDGPLPF